MRVCIIAEGCYPVVLGGLSEWAHLLIKTLKDIEFDVVCIATNKDDKPVYEKLPNVNRLVIMPVSRAPSYNPVHLPKAASEELINCIKASFFGEAINLEKVVPIVQSYPISRDLLKTKKYWDFLTEIYQRTYQDGPFVEYFWTIFGLSALMLDNLRFIREVPRADIYHCLSTGFAGLAGSIARAATGKPLIMTEQGLYLVERQDELSRLNVSDWYRQQIFRFSECLVKTSYHYADRIVPPCQSHMEIEKRLGADPGKLLHINNGIECHRFTPGPSKNGSHPVVGCFARVVPIKGITYLIQAAKLVLEKHPADFVVVGDIQDKEYYKECLSLVKELGLEDHFKFIGHTNALEWYHKTDIFTLSSISEGVPYALLEAMSCGLPSVCTAVGGVPEIIGNGVGYVVPPAQPEKLAEKIGELLVNRDLRLELGARAIRVAREKYTIEEMADKFRNVYEELADERSRVKSRVQAYV